MKKSCVIGRPLGERERRVKLLVTLAGLFPPRQQYLNKRFVIVTFELFNMPAGFPAQVTADSTAFNDKYELFKSATQTGSATEQKIIANNVVYSEILDICKDGQKVFRNDARPQNIAFTTIKPMCYAAMAV